MAHKQNLTDEQRKAKRVRSKTVAMWQADQRAGYKGTYQDWIKSNPAAFDRAAVQLGFDKAPPIERPKKEKIKRPAGAPKAGPPQPPPPPPAVQKKIEQDIKEAVDEHDQGDEDDLVSWMGS